MIEADDLPAFGCVTMVFLAGSILLLGLIASYLDRIASALERIAV
jgi:hypothetical protein